MERTFDELARILTAPRRHFPYGAILLRLAESLAAGFAIGVGIAVVRALAG
ncbi:MULTISPECIES: hypothetical protein [unclassified Mesorhizobium]|uniref:hypothetical protein n=1 Tax=unclassified Mesorhizobium TaxID=325217 RepID=UPI00143F5671|nr:MULTISPECIES: hypothetical protein [unclassified Mesorhizobium]